MDYAPQDRCEAMVRKVSERALLNDGRIDLVKEMSFFSHDVVTVVSM